MEEVESALALAGTELSELAGLLSEVRRREAPKLAKAVQSRLGELAMADARFEVDVSRRPDGCGPRGADAVELLIARSLGCPPAGFVISRRVASSPG